VKKVLLVLLVSVAVAGTATAQTSIVGSPHDMRGLSAAGAAAYNQEVCVYCHTPHKANTAAHYLWNKNLGATPTRDGAPLPYYNVGASGTCLSCHDGTIGVDSVLNFNAGPAEWPSGSSPGFTASWEMTPSNPVYIGSDLSDDHEIGVAYPTAGATGRFQPATMTGWFTPYLPVGGARGIPIYAQSGTSDYTVECSSCHTPHNPANGMFLRNPNTNSQVCLACHIK